MSANSFGEILRFTSFGESHGEAIGGILEGVPAGISLCMESIEQALLRRATGQSAIVSQRKEADQVQLLSGIYNGQTTGTPIGFVIFNTNAKPSDYDHLADVFRPSHADYTYFKKYGLRDHRGGGRSSARETAARVVAGAIASQIIPQVQITAYTSAVGDVVLEKPYTELDFSYIEQNPVRCACPERAQQMEALIRAVRKAGDTIGGTITGVVRGVPAGWGEPIFQKLSARLAQAMFSINAVKAFEYGSGFAAAAMRGSEHNDLFLPSGKTQTNHSGGIQGGISNGMDIYFRVGFKPVATLMMPQPTINQKGEPLWLAGKGRHDPCVLPRAVPIVEAMTALTLADAALQARTNTNG